MSRILGALKYNLIALGLGAPLFAGAQDFLSTPDLISNLVDFLVGAVFFVSLLALVFAGYLYLTSAGNAEASSRAKTLILSSIIGILIASFSFLILNLFSGQFVSFDRNAFSPDMDTLRISADGGNDCMCGSSILYNDQGEEQVWCVKDELCVPDPNPDPTAVATGDVCGIDAPQYECLSDGDSCQFDETLGKAKVYRCNPQVNGDGSSNCVENNQIGCSNDKPCCNSPEWSCKLIGRAYQCKQ